VSVDGTSIFEMREMLDGDAFKLNPNRLLRPDALEEFPHRDYDKLQAAVSSAENRLEVIEQLDCSYQELERWADAYGVELPERYPDVVASSLEAADADAVQGGSQ
jgi:hypothetical protein